MDCKELILSENTIELLGQNALPQEQIVIGGEEWCIEEVDEYLRVFYGDSERLPPYSAVNYPYVAIPKCYGLMQPGGGGILRSFDSLSLESAGILSVQQEPLHLTGRGVICGFLDTGIRYQEDVFRNSNGSTRILNIWDQTIQTGTSPEGFLYGSEYTGQDINEALFQENPLEIVPVTDENGHGTILASIAAGGILEGGRRFTGAAPDADIAVVKLRPAKQNLREYYGITDDAICFSETDVILAIEYLQSLSSRYNKPVVLCIGLGTSYGEHAGNSQLARYCSRVAKRLNRAVMISMGNEGNKSHHAQGIVAQETQTLEIRVDAGVESFVMEIWGRIPYLFSASIRSPSGELIPGIGIRLESESTYQFLYDKTTVTVAYILTGTASTEQLLRLHFQMPSQGIWTVFLSRRGNEGEIPYNAWLPITDFLTGSVYFLTPNPYITLTEPSASTDAIAVAAYQDSNNSIYPAAGRGYTSLGGIKPDIAAPGVMISSILGETSGSDIATAIVGGAAAQYMQWAVVEGNQPNANTQDLKNFLIRGARRLSSFSTPNREFGWGFLDIQNSFQQLIF